mgnify:CR=1 FL=1
MDALIWQEQAFAALFTLTVLLSSVLIVAGVMWVARRLRRKVDDCISEWADHD